MAKATTPLSRLVTLYRQATKQQLKIGFQYGNGRIWDPRIEAYRALNVRHVVSLGVGTRDYVLDNESIETRAIPRSEFWNRLVRHAATGFAEVAV